MNSENALQKQGEKPSYDTMYSRLPDDLRGRVEVCAQQVLDIGKVDKLRGPGMTHWSQTGVNMMRLLGIDEEMIKQKVETRLDAMLGAGRSYGLSSGLDRMADWIKSNGIKDDAVMGPDFWSKYNLADINELKGRLCVDKQGIESRLRQSDDIGIRLSLLSYTTCLDTAFNLAMDVEAFDKAQEAFLHILRLDDSERSYKCAEKLESDDALIKIGMLALVDFFNGKHRDSTNPLYYGIEALKRVQGDKKPLAEEMLYDLAMEIQKPEYAHMAAQVSRDDRPFQKVFEGFQASFKEYALRALRVIGELQKKVPLDSVKVDYRTKVTDPKVVSAVKILCEEMATWLPHGDLKEIRLGLESIGDTEALNRYGENIYKQMEGPETRRQTYFLGQAADYFMAAGNFERAQHAIDKLVDESSVLFSLSSLIRKMKSVGYDQGLKNLYARKEKEMAQAQEDDKPRFKEDLEMIQRVIDGGDIDRPNEAEMAVPYDVDMPGYVRSALVEEQRYIQTLARNAEEVDPDDIPGLISNGYKLMEEKDGWSAYQTFLQASYRKGLVEVADKYIEHNNGLNGRTMLMFAALLPKDEKQVGAVRVEGKVLAPVE